MFEAGPSVEELRTIELDRVRKYVYVFKVLTAVCDIFNNIVELELKV